MKFGKKLSFHTFFKECESFFVGEKPIFSPAVSLPSFIESIVDLRYCTYFEQSMAGAVIFLNKSNWTSLKESKNGAKPAFAFVHAHLKQVNHFEEPSSFPWIWVDDTYPLLVHLLTVFQKQFQRICSGTYVPVDVHPTAIVEGYVEEGAKVGAGCYVGKNSLIKKGSVLEPGVTILDNCCIEEYCCIQSGVVIGCAGFGFYENSLKTKKSEASGVTWESIPHLAGVRIGKQTWIGANTVIASGVLHPTEVGEHCKLDSHIQIAHNVYLGNSARMASQSGIAGSTYIGHHFLVGGASSISGHLNIGNNVTVAARSGVTKSIESGKSVGGYPAQPLGAWKKQVSLLKQWVRERGGSGLLRENTE